MTAVLGRLVGVALAFSANAALAADFHVLAGAAAGGDGSIARPFSQLSQAEAASAPGDRIYVSAKSASDVLSGPITLKPNQKLIGLSPTGKGPRYESEMPLLTSSVIDPEIYDRLSNGSYKPTTTIVQLARGVEVAGLHFIDIKGPALLAGDVDVSGARIHDNAFSGVLPMSKSMIYAVVLGGAANVSGVSVTDNVFRDGLSLGGIVIQQRGTSTGTYHFQRNHFRDLGGRAYFLHSEDTSKIDATILDSGANNLGMQPDGKNVPAAGNSDSIIPYLVGKSQQRVLVKNFHYRNDKQVGGISNTGVEVFIYGLRREEDRANWCNGCRADIEIQDSVFERTVSDAIQIANYGDASIVNVAVRRTKIIDAAPRQTLGAISTMSQRRGNKGGKISILVEDTEIIGTKTFAFANTNDSDEPAAVIDFGGGPLGSKGRNTILGSIQGGFKLENEHVVARNNWWGGATPTVTLAGPGGGVDFGAPLRAAPK